MATTVQNNYTVPAPTKEDEVKKNIDLNEKEKKLCFGLYENNPYGGYRRIFFEWIGLPTGIFFGVAYGVYNGNKAVYDANIALMFPNSWDGVYVSLALFIFVNTMFWVNLFSLKYKGKIYGWDMEKNIQSNTYIYKTMMNDYNYYPGNKKLILLQQQKKDLEEGGGDDDKLLKKPVTLVCLEHDGVVGKFNRANRSLHHMGENSFSIFISAFFLAKIFPLPIFISSIIWSIGRMGHQYMYAEKGYGVVTHLPFYIIECYSRMFMHGLLLIVALRCYNQQ